MIKFNGSSAIPPHRKERITKGLEKLGPDAVMRAMRSFEDGPTAGWEGCFLAFAYGERGELLRDAKSAKACVNMVNVLKQRFPDITLTEYTGIIAAFDHTRDAFQELVLEWLELNTHARSCSSQGARSQESCQKKSLIPA